jgi:hypothetical protein
VAGHLGAAVVGHALAQGCRQAFHRKHQWTPPLFRSDLTCHL